MELDLATVRTKGRAEIPPEAAFARDLTPADLVALTVEKGTKPPALVRLRESHHALARALASGLKPGEAAQATGYTLPRVSILQNDPAFQQLLELYRGEVHEIHRDFQTKLASVREDALDILHERLHDDPDAIKDSHLIEIVKMGADRTGHGPSSKTTNVNVNIELAGRLEAARRRAGMAQPPITPSLPVVEAAPGSFHEVSE